MAFMLFASSFANDTSFSEDALINLNQFTINDFSEATNDTSQILFDCTVTVKDNQTGKSYTITVHGKSCGELIKEIME